MSTSAEGLHPDPHPSGDQGTRSIGEIVADISSDMTTLVRQELDLAKSEMKQEVTKLGKGAGMFGGAGLAGFFTLLFLSLTLVYLLDNFLPSLELSTFVVALLWGIAAAVLAMQGRKKFKEANPQLPITQQTLKEDAQWAKTQKG